MTFKVLLLTLLAGLFFIIGMLIPKFFHNKHKLLTFTTSLSFIIILFLILGDLIPEVIEIIESLKQEDKVIGIVLSLLFILIGIVLLKILDLFVPEHHHVHHEKEDNLKEHNSHIFHIGIITALSLMLHNILEGITIYITGLNNFKLGLLMAISVGCHNLPLGVEIAASMDMNQKKKILKYLTFLILSLSSFIGAFILYLLKTELNVWLEEILISQTIGMLIYISFLELLPELKENKKLKEMKYGVLIGILLSIILCVL